MTALKRPLVVIYDLFHDSILDLSWSTDGHILLACSTDGTIACLQFSANELGKPLSEEDKVHIFHDAINKEGTLIIITMRQFLVELTLSTDVWQECEH